MDTLYPVYFVSCILAISSIQHVYVYRPVSMRHPALQAWFTIIMLTDIAPHDMLARERVEMRVRGRGMPQSVGYRPYELR